MTNVVPIEALCIEKMILSTQEKKKKSKFYQWHHRPYFQKQQILFLATVEKLHATNRH